MDVLFFLRERTKFIRYFYETAAEPFCETIRKIESGETPFDDPPYSEDDEPPFLEEWTEADEGLGVLGRTCISMLSASLQLYFKTWEGELGITWDKGERDRTFKNGFLQGYRTCFGEVLHLSWDECSADFSLLEQVILARNRDQHPDTISTMQVTHTHKDRRKHPHLFFISDTERKMFSDSGMEGISWISPAVHVSRDMLFTAIKQVETLAEWLDERIIAVRYGR